MSFKFGAEGKFLRLHSQYHLMEKSGKKIKYGVAIDRSVDQVSEVEHQSFASV